MYEEDYYEQFEPMPEEYEAIENLVKNRCKDIAKGLVLEINSYKEKLKSQSDLIQKYIGIERELELLKKEAIANS